MGQYIREEFDSGHAPYYVFAVTPLAILISFALPRSFLPFITSAMIFPAVYYYVRSEKLIKAFWVVSLWAALMLVIISGLTHASPLEMEGRIYGYGVEDGYIKVDFNDKSAVREAAIGMGIDRAIGALVILALSVVSGGSLPLLFAALALAAFGLNLGEIINQSHGIDSVILGIKPWLVCRFAGFTMIAIGAASVFYMKLENRPVEYARSLKWILVGATFVAFDIYLFIKLGPAWNGAVAAALGLAN